jgi:putative endonuclease
VKQSLGKFGESWAAGYLTRHGYRIVDRNVRYRPGEIDLVAWKGETLVFVEVKCRTTSSFGSPEASITRARYGRLALAVASYVQERSLDHVSYRIDVVAIEVGRNGSVVRCELVENAEPPAP